ncbi:MAG: hypothetical protein AAF940_09895 [Pseudomonadota bacterium]
MRKKLLAIATIIFSSYVGSAGASSIMCDPAWLMGGVLTYQESLTGIIALAEGNAAFAGDGGEERVCKELQTFRLYVDAGCISKTDQPRVEAAFEPFDCG